MVHAPDIGPVILPLRSASSADPREIGGKAWGLAQLVAGGFEVPDGFVVRGEAFHSALDAWGLLHHLADEEGGFAGGFTDQAHLADRDYAERLQDVISRPSIPESIASAILHGYREIGSPPVAVRSSATFEDSTDASFAGQHRSFLGVCGEQELLAAVRGCWASLWTAEAVSYRHRCGVREAEVRMAVVVQRMVSARISGVAFSIDPVREDLDFILANVVEGLGELLVSGMQTPQEFHLPKGRMRWALSRGLTIVRGKRRQESKGDILAAREQAELRRTVMAIEAWFGRPQDVEFAFEGSRLLILQSRPVTSLSAVEEAPRGHWTRLGFGEWLQRPVSPLFASLVFPELACATDDFIAQRWGLRRPSPTWAIIRGFCYTRASIKLTLSLVFLPFRLLRDARRALEEWTREFVPEYETRVAALSRFRPHRDDPQAIAAHFGECLELAARCWSWIIATGIFAQASSSFVKFLARRIGLGPDHELSLLSGFDNKSVEADEALWNLAESARRDGALVRLLSNSPIDEVLQKVRQDPTAQEWQAAFDIWLQTYGHRVFDLDLVEPTLLDRPEIAIELIRAYLVRPQESPKERVRAAAVRRVRAERAFNEQLQNRSRLASRLVRGSLRLATDYAAIREDRPFYLHMTWPLMRRDVLCLGEYLTGSELLASAEDVFFLTKIEICCVLRGEHGQKQANQNRNYAQLAEERRARRLKQACSKPVAHIRPSFLVRKLSRLRKSARSAVPGGTAAFRGTAGSPGHVRGTARVIRAEGEFNRFQPGEILVAPYTTPAWTPLLALARGVVTEVGGSLAHAAIIAREYGIPAVLGVEGFLDRVTDGGRIDVNGSTGTVTLIDPPRTKENVATTTSRQ